MMKTSSFHILIFSLPLVMFSLLFAHDSMIDEVLSKPNIASETTFSAPAVRTYYLTPDVYQGNRADEVCASGFHFASFWEILDPSNLVYDTHLGHQHADSGEGSPALDKGWIRTGYQSDSSPTPGKANCSVWNTTTGFGSIISLTTDWADPSLRDIGPWDAAIRSCADTAQVWCVSDLPGTQIYLPLLIR